MALGPLTVLAGPDGAGKADLLDVFGFVADALENSPAEAAAQRGGLPELLHRTPDGIAEWFEICLDLAIRVPGCPGDVAATYGFAVGTDPSGEFPLLVLREGCEVRIPHAPVRPPLEPRGRSEHLRLPVSDNEPDAPSMVLDAALRAMRFHQPDVTARRKLDERATARHAAESARNAAEDTRVARDPEPAPAVPDAAFSTGTLQVAWVMAALSGPGANAGTTPLVAIDAPLATLHRAWANSLYEELVDASACTQVIIAAPGADLLGSEFSRPDHIRSVTTVDGVTRIGRTSFTGYGGRGQGR